MTALERHGDLIDSKPAARGMALLRLAFVPVALIQAPSADQRLDPDFFPALLIAFTAYAIAMLALPGRTATHPHLRIAQAWADLVFIAALVYTSGGARSPLLFAFYILPVGAALGLSPRLTALWAAISALAYLIVALPHPQTQIPGDIDLVAGEVAALAWISAAAVMLSVLFARRERSLEALASTRRQLVQQSLDAEARERRRLAQALHDDAIQNVLLARQEVADLVRGVPGAAERAQQALDETNRQLREEVFAMHPVGLERAGLAAVLRSLAADAGRRGRFDVDVRVDPLADEMQDDLVVATAREVLANAAKHSRATQVRVDVTLTDGRVCLVVSDDGVGFHAERLEQALQAGHIGLAATAERVRAVEGEFTVDSSEGRGTTITVLLPMARRIP